MKPLTFGIGAHPGLRRLLWSSVIGRLPSGMLPLILLLLTEDYRDSLAAAGLVSAAYGLGIVVVGPAVGRAVARFGAPPVLVWCVSAHASACVLLVLSLHSGGPLGFAVAASFAAGAVSPPVAATVRAAWARLTAKEDERLALFTVDALIVELVFLAGPLLAGGAVAAGSPVLALTFAALLLYTGSLIMARAREIRTCVVPAHGPHRIRLLTQARLRAVLAVTAAYTAALGLIDFATVTWAVREHHPGAAGLLLSLQALGSIVAGFWVGHRDPKPAPAAQYGAALALLAVAALALAIAPNIVVLALLIPVAGLAITPAGAAGGAMIAASSSPGTAVEAFAWMNAACFAGYSVGTALGGALAEAGGAAAGFLAATACAAAALGLLRVSPVWQETSPATVEAGG